jgi:hypothetical protein
MLIAVIGLGLVSVIVIFKECKPIPPDNSQAKVDSIIRQASRREDSLSLIIAAAQNSETRAWIAADSFNTKAGDAAKVAAVYRSKFIAADNNRVLAADAHDDSSALAWGDSAIRSAYQTIRQQDSVIVKKDSVITNLSRALVQSSRQCDALKQSRDGFKSDFMKIQTDVVKPMQIQLSTERRQHATNRFWKKVFAGTTAVLATNAIIDLIKK